MQMYPRAYRIPGEGEMTFDEALERALAELAKEQNVTDLTGWTTNVQRVSLTANPDEVNCRWQVYITDDPANPVNGWKIQFGEWENSVDVPTVQDITDMSNG